MANPAVHGVLSGQIAIRVIRINFGGICGNLSPELRQEWHIYSIRQPKQTISSARGDASLLERV